MEQKLIEFKFLDDNLVEVLKENNIEEKDLFNHYGDLYVGCKNHQQAMKIMNSGPWKSMSSIFKPQKESDMEKYQVGIDIGLAAMNFDFNSKQNG